MTVGGNMLSVKQGNRAQILSNLHRLGKTSRKELARIMQLTPASITINVNAMISEGIIKEAGLDNRSQSVGRPQKFIDINYDYRLLVGVHIETGNSFACLGTMQLDLIDRRPIKTADRSPEDFLEALAESIRDLLSANDCKAGDCLGIGVSIVGVVDQDQGDVLHAWALLPEPCSLVQELQGLTGMPVFIDNNVRALAQAEYFSCRPTPPDNAMMVKYGNGIGSAFIIKGNFYSGYTHTAGEIGHTFFADNGKRCCCGKTGCLETVASAWSIRESLQLAPDLPEAELVAMYYAGNTEVAAAFRVAVHAMAVSFCNTFMLFDPELIMLYGFIFEIPELLFDLQMELSRLSGIDLQQIKERLVLSNHNLQLEEQSPMSVLLRRFLDSGGLESQHTV
ncbi:ROK family transcriptional regulator [Spirochaeta dissipatitropha]